MREACIVLNGKLEGDRNVQRNVTIAREAVEWSAYCRLGWKRDGFGSFEVSIIFGIRSGGRRRSKIQHVFAISTDCRPNDGWGHRRHRHAVINTHDAVVENQRCCVAKEDVELSSV